MYTQLSGIVCFRLILHILHHYFTLFTGLCWGGFLFVRLGLIGFAGVVSNSRFSFVIRGSFVFGICGAVGGTRDGDLEGDDIFLSWVRAY